MKRIEIENLNENPFTMIGKDWMLITAEKDGKVNTMTASWGGFGVLWGKNVATVYIRNSRYTKEFVDNGEKIFRFAFCRKNIEKNLHIAGKISGRDEDKVAKCGFTVKHQNGVPYFEESRLVFTCKKLYAQQMSKEFFTENGRENVSKFYSDNDWHVMYIAEIEDILGNL